LPVIDGLGLQIADTGGGRTVHADVVGVQELPHHRPYGGLVPLQHAGHALEVGPYVVLSGKLTEMCVVDDGVGREKVTDPRPFIVVDVAMEATPKGPDLLDALQDPDPPGEKTDLVGQRAIVRHHVLLIHRGRRTCGTS